MSELSRNAVYVGLTKRYFHIAYDRLRHLGLIYAGFAIVAIIGITIGHWLPPGKHAQGPRLNHRLLSWDGGWYRNIAEHGYQWNPRIGVAFEHFQNVAFFPLYPMIERLLMIVLGTSGWPTTIIPGLIFGLASISAFDHLARQLEPDPQTARRATLIYAFWPAGCFYLMGYPTGLINLCAIASLAALVRGRTWRAAIWCGLGTAAAPTMVFFAAGLCLDRGVTWLQTKRDFRKIPELLGFGLASVWGLIGFMAYLGWKFGDPLAFVAAQAAWSRPETFKFHLALMVFPPWYGLPFYQTLRILMHPSIAKILHEKFLYALLIFLQKDIDIIIVTIGFFSLIYTKNLKLIRKLKYISSFLLFGYLWEFCSVLNFSFMNGVRLLFISFLMIFFLAKYLKLHYFNIFLLFTILILICFISFDLAGYLIL